MNINLITLRIVYKMELYQYMCLYAVVIIDHWEKWLLHVWREFKGYDI